MYDKIEWICAARRRVHFSVIFSNPTIQCLPINEPVHNLENIEVPAVLASLLRFKIPGSIFEISNAFSSPHIKKYGETSDCRSKDWRTHYSNQALDRSKASHVGR